MTDKLLYYPYINIPRNEWTLQSLLYWDRMGIITPDIYIENPDRYDWFTRRLLQTDLVDPVLPYNYICDIDNFDEGFIKNVQYAPKDVIQRRIAFDEGKVTRIHFQKFGERLLDHLIGLGIARRENWEWYFVEMRTANQIMLYLASVLGKAGDFTPTTDNILRIPDTSLGTIGSIRQKLLEEVMPYPAIDDLQKTDFDKIRKFKEDYGKELKSFRILAEEIAFEISLLPSETLREQGLSLKINKIRDKRDTIRENLKGAGFSKIVFGTLFGISGSLYGFSHDNKPLGLFSLVHAVYSAFQGYNKKSVSSEDYAYLALIDKKFNRPGRR